jgi:DNA modification methylase
MEGDASARLVLADEPYNVKIAGYVAGGRHREFAMASGEMTEAEFLYFNEAWIAAVLPCLCDGGIIGTFIDWRRLPTVHSAAAKLGLTPLNLIVWAKTNGGMGSLYCSQHKLLPLFKKGTAPHRTRQTRPLALERLDLSRRLVARLGSDARRGLKNHPTVKPTATLEDAPRPHKSRRDGHRSFPRPRLDPHRGRENRPRLSRDRTRPTLRRCNHPAL